VDTVRRRDGRFLKKDATTTTAAGGTTWKDVGNNKAREKTSQALREGAPDIRDTTHPNGTTTTTTNTTNHKRTKGGPEPLGNFVSPMTSSGSLPTISTSTDDDPPSVDEPASKKAKTEHVEEVAEDVGSSDHATEEQPRGPRLKQLKSRLMCEEKLEDEA